MCTEGGVEDYKQQRGLGPKTPRPPVGTEIVLPGDFVSLNTAELYGAQFYQKLKVARN